MTVQIRWYKSQLKGITPRKHYTCLHWRPFITHIQNNQHLHDSGVLFPVTHRQGREVLCTAISALSTVYSVLVLICSPALPLSHPWAAFHKPGMVGHHTVALGWSWSWHLQPPSLLRCRATTGPPGEGRGRGTYDCIDGGHGYHWPPLPAKVSLSTILAPAHSSCPCYFPAPLYTAISSDCFSCSGPLCHLYRLLVKWPHPAPGASP